MCEHFVPDRNSIRASFSRIEHMVLYSGKKCRTLTSAALRKSKWCRYVGHNKIVSNIYALRAVLHSRNV